MHVSYFLIYFTLEFSYSFVEYKVITENSMMLGLKENVFSQNKLISKQASDFSAWVLVLVLVQDENLEYI